jgi:3-phosphoshikimate 1-carboxyvinyltransferase
MRLLAGAISAAGLPAVLDGSPGLRRRPMNRIIFPLRAMGVRLEAVDGFAPLTFSTGDLPLSPPEQFLLNVPSAQVKTCLLLAGLSADRTVRILEPGPSRDHSERMLAAMGAAVRTGRTDGPGGELFYEVLMEPPAVLAPLQVKLPGDFSSAAFLIVAALITEGADILLQGVGLNPTRTGLLDALRAMGAKLAISAAGVEGDEPYGDIRIRHSRLRGTTVSGPLVVRMIDEFPAFAIAAAFAEGPTVVSEAGELRHKESDRIHSLCTQLHAIGIEAEELAGGFRIPGGAVPAGGVIHPGGDHRIAMALAVAGLGAAGPVSVGDSAIISESFPGFVAALQYLGAHIDP